MLKQLQIWLQNVYKKDVSIKVFVGLLVFYYELSWFVSIFNANKNYTYFLTIILYYIYGTLSFSWIAYQYYSFTTRPNKNHDSAPH